MFRLPKLPAIKSNEHTWLPWMPRGRILNRQFLMDHTDGKIAMSNEREIRCYDYVNHPYEQVRDALTENALAVFQSATKAAASRAKSVASELRMNIAGIEVGTDISITVKDICQTSQESSGQPATRLQLEWEASNAPRLFPLMKADLSVYPLTTTETQLDFAGHYQPPLGAVGAAINSIVGHRIADVTVHRFVADVAQHLRTSLPQ